MHDPGVWFGISHDVLIHVDRDRRILAINPMCARTLGFTETELVGTSLLELVHPNEREELAGRLGAVQASDEPVVRLRSGDGLYHRMNLRCTRDEASGELFVSARRTDQESALRAELGEARRILAAMFECTQDYVLITDKDIVVTHTNRDAEGLNGTTIGKPMLSFSAPEELEGMTQRVEEVMRTGKTIAYEVRAMYPDGSLWDFSSRLGPVRDGDATVGVVLITRDVTAERRTEAAKRHAEQQLKEYMIQLERSNRELERFASVASHDLQEPLRKIQAFSDRLRDKFQVELTDTGRDYLERIRSAAKRMQDLINDLLMFSRLSAKEQTYARVNLAKIARSVLSDLEVRIEETGGKVLVGELPTIDADPVHMRQLLQNLISNALKFTRQDVPPVVDLRAEVVQIEHESGEAGMLRLVVADNGIGIDPKYHDRIFGIFERLHGRGKYEGTGVGLAVCRKIVEQHHGTIQVDSVVGEGTKFTILLPVKQPERSQKT